MQAVAVLAVADLVGQWAPPADALEAVEVGRDLIRSLAQTYAQTNAAVAADFYESVRPAGSPPFTPAPQVRDDLVGGGTLNWSTQPLTANDFDLAIAQDETLSRIAESIMLATREAAIEALGEMTEQDPLDARFARFPQSSEPCAWCVLRASRGALYWSEEAATRGDHRDCRCKATPVFPGEVLPYMRSPYIAQYQNGASDPVTQAETAAIRADRSLSPAERQKALRSALLAGMRRANGTR